MADTEIMIVLEGAFFFYFMFVCDSRHLWVAIKHLYKLNCAIQVNDMWKETVCVALEAWYKEISTKIESGSSFDWRTFKVKKNQYTQQALDPGRPCFITDKIVFTSRPSADFQRVH